MNESLESLVEARILSLEFDVEAKKVSMRFRLAGGRREICLVSSGVEEFRIADCRLQNIVEEVRISRGSKTSVNELKAEVETIILESGSPARLISLTAAKYIDLILSSELTLVSVEPIYGAQISLIATTILLDDLAM
jgi:hypothetical protein